MTVNAWDGHPLADPDRAAALLELLDLISEVLRYGSDDLRADITDRYTSSTFNHLLESLDCHTGLLRRTVNPTPRTS
jgi:hypothetical protein